jgi:hypothetical protein
MIPIGRAHLSVEEGGGEGTLSGLGVIRLRPILRLGRIGPLQPFILSLFLFLFYFLISDLFHIFCKF